MKKIFFSFALIIVCTMLVGCGDKKEKDNKKEPTTNTTTTTTQRTGGWTTQKDIATADMPKEAKEAFTKAAESYDKASLEPVACSTLLDLIEDKEVKNSLLSYKISMGESTE